MKKKLNDIEQSIIQLSRSVIIVSLLFIVIVGIFVSSIINPNNSRGLSTISKNGEREGDPDDTLCRVENVKNPRKLGSTLHQMLTEYLAVHSTVSPKIEGRVTATDQPSNLLSQLEGYDYQFI